VHEHGVVSGDQVVDALAVVESFGLVRVGAPSPRGQDSARIPAGQKQRIRASACPYQSSGLRQTDTWLSLSDVKGAASQSATRCSSVKLASRAMRSHSAGQM
jgi:hypothetical protein